MTFPFDFGFVPSTLGEDGDPLDILVLMDAPVVPGCVIRARLIGAIEAKQKAKGESWERNDRLIAVAVHAQTHAEAQSLTDLRPHLVEEIKKFFVNYNELRGRKFKPLALAGGRTAQKLIKTGIKAFKKLHGRRKRAA
jgi:inorganic pyrophosphatase